VNLFLALFWLALAVAAFVSLWTGVEPPGLRLSRGAPFVGSLALVFCAYNFVRWFSLRQLARARRDFEERRERRRPRREPAAETPDPTFDFRDRPPPDEGIRPSR
jgi:hypothetical protein